MPEVAAALDGFTAEVAAILERDPDGISPGDRLVADLDFDSLALTELAILLMERYGSQNFLTALNDDLDLDALTIRSVFENYAGKGSAGG